jgi:hypothetical protein
MMHIDTRSSIVVIDGIGNERELLGSAPREGESHPRLAFAQQSMVRDDHARPTTKRK